MPREKPKRSLTNEQMAVVCHEGGHALVEAVPGSGKTTVLVARLRRELRRGVDPCGILAVMFNKAAQVGFTERLRRACPEAEALPEVRTFHSVGFRILKNLVSQGIVANWQLRTAPSHLDRLARQCLREAWAARHGKHAKPSSEQFSEFVRFITLVKSDVKPAKEVFELGSYSAESRPFIEAFDRLWQQQQRQRVMFFDDLVYRPVLALGDDANAWERYGGRYEAVLVDELQDINPNGFAMVRGLAGTHAKVMGCGDANQSIYGFRGADVTLMTRQFAKAFAPCTRYPMSRTFRFGHAVALLANHLIGYNRERTEALVISAESTPASTVERIALTKGKPSGITELLQTYHQRSDLHRAALLARNFSHLVPFELELADAEIPYHVYGRQPLVFLPEIAALVCAVSLVARHWIVPESERGIFLQAFMCMPPTFLPRRVTDRIVDALEVRLEMQDYTGMHDTMLSAAGSANGSYASAWRNLERRADAMRLFTSRTLDATKAGAIVDAYIRMTDMRATVERSAATPEQASEAIGTLDAFVELAEKSGSARDLLDRLTPMAAVREDKPPEGDHLRLTTLHRSKGLEWSLVMVAGLARGIFPDGDLENMEENRRLAYVGFTRAIDRLVLFHPVDSTLDEMASKPAYTPDRRGMASPFLYEADLGLSRTVAQAIAEPGRPAELTPRHDRVASSYLQACGAGHVTLKLTEASRNRTKALRNAIPADVRFKRGDTVIHPHHGQCKVVRAFHHPIYEVTSETGGQPFSAVLTADNQWSLGSTPEPNNTEHVHA